MFEDSHDDPDLLTGELFGGFKTGIFECVDLGLALVVAEFVDVGDVLFL